MRGRHRRAAEYRSKSRPALLGGATAASDVTPGAAMSGLSRSPPRRATGPREENAGDLRHRGRAPVWLPVASVAVAPAVAAYGDDRRPVGVAPRARWAPSGSRRRGCSASGWPAPCRCRRPASPRPTSRPGRRRRGRRRRSCRPPWPGRATRRAQRRVRVAPGRPDGGRARPEFRSTGSVTGDAGTRRSSGRCRGSPCPRSGKCVLAATVVTQGLGCSTVEAPGPELPAEAATKMPAEAAHRKASSTGSIAVVQRRRRSRS